MKDIMQDVWHRWSLNITLAVLAALVFALFFSPMSWAGLAATAVVALGTGLGINHLLDLHDAGYRKRMNAAEPFMWVVWLNGVPVGSVSDAQYAKLQRDAFRDARNILGQAINLGRVAMALVDKMTIAVPVMCFWIAVAVAAVLPQAYTQLLHVLQKADPAAVAAALCAASVSGLKAMALFYLALLAFGYRYCFAKTYSNEVATLLRQHCNTPAEGTIRLTRMTEETVHHHNPVRA